MTGASVHVAYCRTGFEGECAQELRAAAGASRLDIDISPAPGSAVVVANAERWTARELQRAVLARPLVFARSVFTGSGPHVLPARDRISPLLALMSAANAPFAAIWLEYPDTNEGKSVSGLCRRLEPLLLEAARNARLYQPDDKRGLRFHVLFTATDQCYVGSSSPETGSPWPMGIARISMPHGAPSRSTLKLAEAFLTFLDADERERLLRPGLRAVDLGAAPGGWTWQFAERGIRVTAVDNAALKGSVAVDPLVEHVRDDGLFYRARRRVDWMVCDIVEKPARIAALVASWLADGACRRSIFNLKLPMKKRYDEVQRCAEFISETLEKRGVRCSLRLKQLYHDREEVTGYCARID